MKILVVNCGSSSIKYQLVDMKDESVVAKGLVERIGMEGSVLTHQPTGHDKVVIKTDMPTHTVGIKLVLGAFVNPDYGVIKSMDEIGAVGHRVVHGGEKFSASVLITPDVMHGIEECIDMAPLHNPPNIAGINACKEVMPNVPHVAVFDTAFHQTMPKYSFLYGLPYDAYIKYGLRRYGFHGTSHKFVSQRAAAMLGKPMSELKMITCHLGNGSSVAAVKNGKCMDTSMGFTPLEGLVMGTRSGVIDPAIIPFLMKKAHMTGDEVDSYLNKKSGVLGISGVSSDFRDIEEAYHEGNERAGLALDIFAYKVRKYIGSYAAAMGGVDVIVFTAGLGENSATMREKICENLEFLGVFIDHEKNQVRGKETNLSAQNAKVQVLLIPTNEELMIARDTNEICNPLKK
ncbi:acetate kinase [Sporomusaceae bacterium BoRhaA]|uniref:acetate/propionate family kinase n=1 Tax=Pelorhabdus rhamnosifermentans TaxID=2772457 RepID=UPI001C062008|nr:acetate kinase [Pelorhabdus rhamnosifermentans]MBU2701202.1 acetate kinase [Pelorhabdus rhamnosifermentans]